MKSTIYKCPRLSTNVPSVAIETLTFTHAFCPVHALCVTNAAHTVERAVAYDVTLANALVDDLKLYSLSLSLKEVATISHRSVVGQH